MGLDGIALKKAKERTSTTKKKKENKYSPKKQNDKLIPANLRE